MEYIYIIVLNYNNSKDTIECVDSLLNSEKQLLNCLKILIIDNGSSDNSYIVLKKYYLENDFITICKTGENIGYAGGNNYGIRIAKNNNAKYIVILNNDTIAKTSFIYECIDALNSDKSLGVVGPVLLEYDKDIIQSAGADIDFLRLRTPIKHSGEIYSSKNEVEICDYIGGACLIFNSSLIDDIGELPEDYFLFWEEVEWCNKVNKMGRKCGCIWNAFLEHKGSATINQYEGIYALYIERNKVIFSYRNSKFLLKYFSIFLLYVIAIAKGIIIDKKFFSYIRYYNEGIKYIKNV